MHGLFQHSRHMIYVEGGKIGVGSWPYVHLLRKESHHLACITFALAAAVLLLFVLSECFIR